ncbi:MAG: pyridoxal phosphate-dependent aminotransferase, partial [Bacteroidales bacterium]|nr:pyridoxal phosphate-dependent aminotransferase [Bacteroidales bacterium]
EKFAMWMLQEFEYNKQTVMLAPGSGFYTTPGSGKQEVRIAYVRNLDDLKNAMECLKRGLEQYPGRV